MCLMAMGGFSVSQAQTLTVGSSGIDWEASIFTVSDFTAAHPSHKANFNCFGKSYTELPISQTLADLGFESSDSGPLTLTTLMAESTCFQQAGDYVLQLQVQDQAGNVAFTENEVTVVPSELDLQASSVLPAGANTSGGSRTIADITQRRTCTSPSLLADGQDECVLEVRLQDRFANVVSPNGASGDLVLNLNTAGQAQNLDASQNLYGAFLKGLYFANNTKQVRFSLPSSAQQLQVGLKSYVPTLENTNADKSGNPVYEVMPQTVKVNLAFTPEGEKIIEEEKTIKPLFGPWVGVVANPKEGLENYLQLPLNRLVQVPFKIQNWVKKTLPSRLTLDWQAAEVPDLWVRFQSAEGDKKEKTIQQRVVTAQAAHKDLTLGVELIRPEGVGNTSSVVQIQPTVTYPQSTPEGTQLVRYPLNIMTANGAELLAAFSPLQLQAAVEGKRLAGASTDSNEGVVLSASDKLLFTRWREQITRQGLDLVRGQEPRLENVLNISRGFGDEAVYYFKGGTLRLTSDELNNEAMVFNQGRKTIIIEDGNLLITRDLVYAGPEDSLGVILINSNPNDAANGHVFVHQNVQRLAGSYFLDGALLSTQNLLEPNITDSIVDREKTTNQDESAPLALQLILEGTLFSRNTLGGADQTPSIGPNGQSLRRESAVVYDLNYLRRYEPLFDDQGVRIPDEENDYCAKLEADVCYPNSAPTVIRYDGRAVELPPPGFK